MLCNETMSTLPNGVCVKIAFFDRSGACCVCCRTAATANIGRGTLPYASDIYLSLGIWRRGWFDVSGAHFADRERPVGIRHGAHVAFIRLLFDSAALAEEVFAYDALVVMRARRSVIGKCACITPTGSARPLILNNTAVLTT